MPGQIVFVCGHSNWGKSKTLGALTGGKDPKWAQISDVNFWVRKMSNDDKPTGYIDRMGRLDPEADPHVIAALCPAFGAAEKDPSDLLGALRARGYALHFWVIEHKYDGTRTVAREEIARLQTFGEVEVFPLRVEAEERARQLAAFVQHHVIAPEGR